MSERSDITDTDSVDGPGRAEGADPESPLSGTSVMSQTGSPQCVGRYEIQRLLGRGGMGQVFLAYDRDLDRQVALKMPDFERLQDRRPEAVERFLREARSMASLQHPNLCPIYDVGEDNGRPFLTMAYIDGPDLARKMIPDEPLPVEETLQIIRKLARAMQVVHDAGIIHRDLKPSNVMINPSGEPVVMDFGLAQRRRVDEVELTSFGDIVGSPMYMSPEQVHGEVDLIGPPTDVYALGTMMYVMLCGRKPFEGSTTHILAKTALHEVPPLPSEFVQISRDVEAVCCRAMAPLIDDRYQSARELADAIDQLLDGSANPGFAAWTPRCRPRTKRYVVAAASCAVLAFSFWGAGSQFRPDLSRPEQAIAITTAPVSAVHEETSAAVSPPTATSGSERWLVDSQQSLGAASTLGVAAGDLDGDGDTDIVTANAHNAPSRVWLNDGHGHFELKLEFPTRDSNDVLLADLDQDGDLDLIFANGPRAEAGVPDSLIAPDGESEFCTVWLNNGDSTFRQTSRLSAAGQVISLAGVDLDSDGDADLILAVDGQPLQVWRNVGDARFEAAEKLELDETRSDGSAIYSDVVLGDLDGDSDLDLFVCLSRAPNRIWWNEEGQLKVSGEFLGRKFEHSQAALADLDGDSDLDVIVSSYDMPPCTFTSSSDGSFQFSEYSLSRRQTPAIAAGDLNGDGMIDFVVGGDSGIVVVFRNADSADTEQLIASNSTRSVLLTDLNGDGLLDAFVANGSEQPNRVLFNSDEAPASSFLPPGSEREGGNRPPLAPWPPGKRPGGPPGGRPDESGGI
ncbi:MAG: VCBS repeat-containing protein [Rhodopirellula sp.]|nr:VCBS repeat-containing protein [Rhodopirellula sp.]